MKPVRILIVILLYSFTVVVYCQAQVEPSFKRKAGETSKLLQAALGENTGPGKNATKQSRTNNLNKLFFCDIIFHGKNRCNKKQI